jgi:ankyrin repeat protein
MFGFLRRRLFGNRGKQNTTLATRKANNGNNAPRTLFGRFRGFIGRGKNWMRKRLGLNKTRNKNAVSAPVPAKEGDQTLLRVACQEGALEDVRRAIKEGAKVNHVYTKGLTALHYASQKGHLDIVRELLAKGAAVDAEAVGGATPLFVASYNGHLAVVRELLSGGAAVDATSDVGGDTALLVAIRAGHLGVVRELLSGGASVDTVNDAGETPLSVARQKGKEDVVRELLAQGAENVRGPKLSRRRTRRTRR